MVTIEDNADREFIEETEVFDPSPSEFLPSNSTVKLTVCTESKGLGQAGEKWNGHNEVYSIFTDSHLYVVSSDDPVGEYIKIPYGAVTDCEYNNPTFRQYQTVQFETTSEVYTLYLKKSESDEAVETAISLLSSDGVTQDLSEGDIEDLYIRSRKDELDAEFIEEFYVGKYNFDEGTLVQPEGGVAQQLGDEREYEVIFKQNEIEIKPRSAGESQDSIAYSDIVGIETVGRIYGSEDNEKLIRGETLHIKDGSLILLGYKQTLKEAKRDTVDWSDDLVELSLS